MRLPRGALMRKRLDQRRTIVRRAIGARACAVGGHEVLGIRLQGCIVRRCADISPPAEARSFANTERENERRESRASHCGKYELALPRS